MSLLGDANPFNATNWYNFGAGAARITGLDHFETNPVNYAETPTQAIQTAAAAGLAVATLPAAVQFQALGLGTVDNFDAGIERGLGLTAAQVYGPGSTWKYTPEEAWKATGDTLQQPFIWAADTAGKTAANLAGSFLDQLLKQPLVLLALFGVGYAATRKGAPAKVRRARSSYAAARGR